MINIAALYPNYIRNAGIGYAALSVLEAMQSDAKVSLMGITSDPDVTQSFYRNAYPSWSRSLAYRFFSHETLKQHAEFRFSRSLKDAEIAYLWPATSLALYQTLKKRGHSIIMESVNTHQATSKSILDAEYARLRMAPSHGITDEAVADESERLKLADMVFSCSPLVTASLLAAGVAPHKILDTTYGFRETEILKWDDFAHRSNSSAINAIFVGSIGVRKGPHLILDYWCRSNVKGKLTLVGDIQPEFRPIIEPYLKRPDIEHVPFVEELTAIYRDADVFLLPSLEEGSPLVTYLALGAGLPCIVSPMGGGGIIEHGKQGFVLDPHHAESWIEALQKISQDVALRKSFSANALAIATNYLWAKVGLQRAKLLLNHLQLASASMSLSS